LHEALREQGAYRILISPDHPTPIRLKTHNHGAVPFAIAGADVKPDAATMYDEIAAGASQLAFNDGWRLMRYFLDLTK
jgi:2,3-bisphosphoglycerate-independent phosphoglycerate mutase